MPLFEYVCSDCGEAFEAVVMGDAKAACPRCESRDLRRLMSTFAVGHGGGSGSKRAPAPRFSGG